MGFYTFCCQEHALVVTMSNVDASSALKLVKCFLKITPMKARLDGITLFSETVSRHMPYLTESHSCSAYLKAAQTSLFATWCSHPRCMTCRQEVRPWKKKGQIAVM